MGFSGPLAVSSSTIEASGGHFFRSKSDMLSLFQPVIIPKGSMFFLHPFHESVSTHIPINLVSVRNKREGSVSWVYPICAQ